MFVILISWSLAGWQVGRPLRPSQDWWNWHQAAQVGWRSSHFSIGLEVLSLFDWVGGPLTFQFQIEISQREHSRVQIKLRDHGRRRWQAIFKNNSFQNRQILQNGNEIGWTFPDQSFFQLKLSWRPRSKTTSQNTSCSLSSAPILGRWTILF